MDRENNHTEIESKKKPLNKLKRILLKVPASINLLESITCILIQILYVYGNLRGIWCQGCVSRKRLDCLMAKYIEKDKKALKRWVQISSLLFETAHNAQSISLFFLCCVDLVLKKSIANWVIYLRTSTPFDDLSKRCRGNAKEGKGEQKAEGERG